MLTVQNDWIEYEADRMQPVQARRVAVRGGAACAQRMTVVGVRPVAAPQRAAARSTGTGQRPSVPPAARPGRLRLTRRGRVVLVVLPALLALSGALLAAAPGAAQAAPRGAARTVVVGAGDSLWSIAERIAPRTDPRITIAAVERANHLLDSQVAAGVVLVLPAG